MDKRMVKVFTIIPTEIFTTVIGRMIRNMVRDSILILSLGNNIMDRGLLEKKKEEVNLFSHMEITMMAILVITIKMDKESSIIRMAVSSMGIGLMTRQQVVAV